MRTIRASFDTHGRWAVCAVAMAGAVLVASAVSVSADASAFARQQVLALAEGENGLRSAVIDTTGTYAYIGTHTQPGRIVKVHVPTMTSVEAITLNTGEDLLRSAVIDSTGTYAYFGTYTAPGKVVKVQLSPLARVGALTLNAGEANLTSAVISGGRAYFGTDTIAGRVVEVQLSPLARTRALTLGTGENHLLTAVAAGGHGYFATFTDPAKVVKVDLSSMTKAGVLTLNAGESWVESAVVDPAGANAYYGTLTSPGRVVKVRLSDLSRAGAVTLDQGRLSAAVMDPGGAFAFFGTHSLPGRVVRVQLSDLTQTGAVTLLNTENFLRSAVIDPDGQFALFGSGTAPGRVIKLKIGGVDTRHSTTTTLSCNDGPFFYTGDVHTPCTAWVTGPDLDEEVDVSYADNISVGSATASAHFPGDDGYKPSGDSTTFAISPWSAVGFAQPVGAANSVFAAAPDDPPSPGAISDLVWNTTRGGVTVPLKFQIFAGDVQKTSTADVNSFTATRLTGCAGTGGDADEVDYVTNDKPALRYDNTEEQFVQNWKTPKVSSAEECYRATIRFADGSSLSAFFRLRK
jgi:hypothetical protein